MSIANMLLATALALAGTDPGYGVDCGPIEPAAAGDAVVRQATALFEKETAGTIGTYEVSREECRDEINVFFAGTGKFRGIGRHALVTYDKAGKTFKFHPGQ